MVKEKDNLRELAIIKKKYGENMMHFCRSLFPSIIEEGNLSTLLLKNFEPSRHLYDDIVQNGKQVAFADYIYSLHRNNAIVCYDVDKSPSELLDSVGYILYECNTMDEVNSFIKYSSPFFRQNPHFENPLLAFLSSPMILYPFISIFCHLL